MKMEEKIEASNPSARGRYDIGPAPRRSQVNNICVRLYNKTLALHTCAHRKVEIVHPFRNFFHARRINKLSPFSSNERESLIRAQSVYYYVEREWA